MGLRTLRAGYAIVYVILLCALATGTTEGKRRADMLFRNGSPILDEEMAEQALIHCWRQLIGSRGSFEEFNLYMQREAKSNLKSTLLTKGSFHEIISVLPPKMKLELLDCLEKRSLLSSYQGDGFRNWLIKCFKLQLDWTSSPRRYLASKSHRKRTARTDLSPASVFTAVSSGYGAASSNQPPAVSTSRSRLTLQFFEKKLQRKGDITDSPPPPPSRAKRRRSPPSSPSSSHIRKHYYPPPAKKNIKQQTTIAIVSTAVATFCFVAFLFLCWCCCKDRNNRRGKRDERPLLHINPSASNSSLSLGNSSNKFSSNSGRTTSFKSIMSRKFGNHDSSHGDSSSSEGNVGEGLPPLKPPPGRAAPPPPGPPQPPAPPAAPRPPPPPKATARAPPAPPIKGKGKLKPSPLGPRRAEKNSSEGDDVDNDPGAQKAKLKPFFWDKVMANPDHSMVWHEISSGSFQFNEEMIESLFGYNAADNSKKDRKKDPTDPSIQYIKIIDSRKAQNLSILLRALNVTTEEVLDALQEGNELPVELLQTLLKMAPTQEEELKLRLFEGDTSQLGPAERFLKVLVEIPCAFKRIEALVFMSSLQEEVSTLKESFATLEVACNKLRNSRLFLKLLEAVLKTGNRMNDGTFRGGAQAFKLDTLLKLSDVKGIDGKTTLLHFVVQEIIRSEGIRAVRTARPSQSFSSAKSDDFIDNSNAVAADHYRSLGLKVVSGLSTELEDVRKAAVIDGDSITSTVSKLRQSLTKTKAFLDSDLKSLGEESEFYHALASFMEKADADISWLSEEEKRITALVKSTADYFHGNAGRDEGLRLFTIVRDFLIILDKTCKEVRDDRAAKPMKTSKKDVTAMSTSDSQKSDGSVHRLVQFMGKRADYSSSDDESPSP